MTSSYWKNGNIMHIWPQREIGPFLFNGINHWFYENGSRQYIEQWDKSFNNGPKIWFRYK